MYPNVNAGLGALMAQGVVDQQTVDTTGRFFFVGASSLAAIQEIQGMYPGAYPDGVRTIFTTIALANAACVASRGDVIFCVPGHTESISSATALTMSVAGVTVIGLGLGNLRPQITLDTIATATINVTANNVTFKNLIFIANVLNVTALFTLTTATDFKLLGCDVRDTDVSHNFVTMVVTDTTSNHADGLTIDSCNFNLLITTGATKLVSALGTNDRWLIQNNYYRTPTTNAGAVLPIATGKILTNFRLLNNIFDLKNAAGTGTGFIITTDGSTNTGFIHNNFDHALPTTPLFCTASSGFSYGLNYHADVADLAGYLVPGADT